MKYFLFIVLFSLKACWGMSQEIISVQYVEETRGFRKEVIINSKEISIDENTVVKKKKQTPLNWKKITDFSRTIRLEKLSTFQSPTRRRASDAALHATLIIKTASKTYESTTFDNDNPPKEISELVKTIQTMAAK